MTVGMGRLTGSGRGRAQRSYPGLVAFIFYARRICEEGNDRVDMEIEQVLQRGTRTSRRDREELRERCGLMARRPE